MNRPDSFVPPFRLNGWLVRPALNRIGGPGGDVQVEPRVMQVLLALAARPGQVILRDSLLDEVWGDQIVGEENLTRAISELRRIFGDSARKPEFIETIRNHGYRLIAPVVPERPAEPPAPPIVPEPIAPESPAPAAEPTPATRPLQDHPDPAPAAAWPPRSWSRRVWLAVLLPVLAVAVVWGWSSLREAPPAGSAAVRLTPLTAYPGRERQPALSPDGTRVAFVWNGFEEGGNTHVYVRQLNSDRPLQVTEAAGWTAWPAWSPDGQTLAYVQGEPGGAALCTVPSLGGTVRRLHRSGDLIEGVGWTADGSALVFAEVDTLTGLFTLTRLDLATLRTSRVRSPDPASVGDVRPRFAPGGEGLAWVRVAPGGEGILMAADRPDGQARELAAGMGALAGLTWSADGSAVVFAAAPGGVYGLWSVPAGGGECRPVDTGADMAWQPDVCAATGDLVFEQIRMDQDLWSIRVLGRDPWRLQSSVFARSTRWESAADFGPDGRQVAFVSSRSGSAEIWLADTTGVDPGRLTDLGAASVTNPRWSPDGSRIAATVLRGGLPEVAVLDARGGVPVFPLDGRGSCRFCSWSADGRSLLAAVEEGGRWRLVRLDPEAGAGQDLRPVLPFPVLHAEEDPASGGLYFTRPVGVGLWFAAPDGAAGFADPGPEPVISGPGPQDAANWRLAAGRIAWVMRVSGQAYLVLDDPATGESSLVTNLPGFSGHGLAVHPRGRAFLYPRTGPIEADLMLRTGH